MTVSKLVPSQKLVFCPAYSIAFLFLKYYSPSKFNNSYYYFGVSISTSSITVNIISKSKISFRLGTS